MPYSIPSDEEIVDALENILSRMKGIDSLKKLRRLVIKELRMKDNDLTVGSERLRKLAVTAPFVKTEIETTQAQGKQDLKGRCPVCGGELEMTKNETIFGGEVTLGYVCSRCPYWTTLKRRIPTRYRFEYKKKDEVEEEDEEES